MLTQTNFIPSLENCLPVPKKISPVQENAKQLPDPSLVKKDLNKGTTTKETILKTVNWTLLFFGGLTLGIGIGVLTFFLNPIGLAIALPGACFIAFSFSSINTISSLASLIFQKEKAPLLSAQKPSLLPLSLPSKTPKEAKALFQYLSLEQIQKKDSINLKHPSEYFEKIARHINNGHWNLFLNEADQFKEDPNAFAYILMHAYEQGLFQSIAPYVTARVIHNNYVKYPEIKLIPATKENLSDYFKISETQATYLLDQVKDLPSERFIIAVPMLSFKDLHTKNLSENLRTLQYRAKRKKLDVNPQEMKPILQNCFYDPKESFEMTISYGMHEALLKDFGVSLIPTEGTTPNRKAVYQQRESKQSPFALPMPWDPKPIHGSVCPFFAFLHDLFHSYEWSLLYKIETKYPNLLPSIHSLYWKAQDYLDSHPMNYSEKLESENLVYPRFKTLPTKQEFNHFFMRRLSASLIDGIPLLFNLNPHQEYLEDDGRLSTKKIISNEFDYIRIAIYQRFMVSENNLEDINMFEGHEKLFDGLQKWAESILYRT